ncbi:DUF6365 family protein, partial [Frankia sp. CgS1]|uniref:DUF6365 family protein n=1 Tax=Frankia sp. CgS1 TaxID=1745381 RepID=UPI000A480D88
DSADATVPRELAARIPELVLHYLTRLPATTEFLVAGPDFGAFGRLPEGRLHRRPRYGAREYLDLLGAADAVLALSLPSFALERAVWTDVPGVAVVNGFDLADDNGVERLHAAIGEPSPAVRSWLDAYPGPLPSYQTWPMRWNDLVRPTWSGNPFAATMVHEEILDEESVSTALEAVLYDESVRTELAEARAGYRRALAALPATIEAFHQVASVHGLTF